MKRIPNPFFLKNSRIRLKVVLIYLTACALLSLPAVEVFAQTNTVSGKVMDAQGPIPGATVKVKDTTIGVVTDNNGNYAINVPENAVLVFSFLGYVEQSVAVNNRNSINITLQSDTKDLDEVVIVGYGSINKKSFTGNVTTVKVADAPIGKSFRTNIMDVLRGTAPGISVSRELGAGSNPTIRVQGQKSIKGGFAPLIVLDGVIYLGNYRDIDPSTIESVSVLKDASSLAAYGSQAANGVIAITTKKGVIGKPVINFTAANAISNITELPNFQNPETYVRRGNASRNLPEDASPQSWLTTTDYNNFLAGNTTDWVDFATRTGYSQNYSASISGAAEKLSYFTSLSSVVKQGTLIGDDYTRHAAVVRLQSDITDWFQFGVQSNFTYNNYDGIGASISPHLSPFGAPYRPNGGLEKYPSEGGINYVNPLWSTYKANGTIDDYERFSSTYLKGHLLIKAPGLKELSYRLNVAYLDENYKHDNFQKELFFVTEGTGETRYSPTALAINLNSANGYNIRRLNNNYVIDNILSYSKQFGKHFIDATAVYTRNGSVVDDRRQTGANFAPLGNTLLSYNGLPLATTKNFTFDRVRKSDVGYLGRINYSYAGKYDLSASVRRDGSSVFGEDKKFGVFPAIGAAWTVSEETFMKNVPTFTFLKVKASWGKNGNQSLAPYGTLTQIGLGQTGGHGYSFGNTNDVIWGQYIDGAIGNPALGWETTTAINIGLEAGLLKDRIRVEVNTYKSKTTDQIFSRTIPVFSNGTTAQDATLGQVDNWGIEAILTTRNIEKRDLQWTSSFNFWLNRNKLINLYGDGKDDLANKYFIGKSLAALYGYKFIGLVQAEDTDYITANNATPGDAKFENVDGSADGRITASDRTILGYSKENFRLNTSQTFRYKNFELFALVTGTFSGNGFGLVTNAAAYRGIINNDWWTPQNTDSRNPRPAFGGANFTPVMGYGFVRLQDLNLSYTFSPVLLKNMHVGGLSAFIAAKNVFTITKWEGGDPETQQTFQTIQSTTGDNSFFLERTVSLGVNLKF